MADVYGPFDGVPWSQAQWYTVAKNWSASGINGTPASSITSGAFAVTSSGLSLTVAAAGFGSWVRGSGFQPDTNKVLSATANGNASLSRRDRLVIRRDLAAKTTTVERLQGTAAASPTAPALTQSDTGTWEIPICSFLVPPNNGTTLTGFVDERAWIEPSDSLTSYFTTAARDANIPSPVTGQVARVAGLLYVYEGGWGSLINNGGNSGVLAGSAPPTGQPLICKTFFGTAATNSSGDTTVFFPGGAFPNGVASVVAFPYATSVNCGMWSGSSTSFANIRVWDGGSGLPVGALPALILHVTAWGW